MSYDQLSYGIRKYIREQGWRALRPIQNAAISRILVSEDNFILASKTASGKTEAAFLPILSKLNFNEPGILVLYISPLIALINDQFYRIEELCSELDIEVTKWHGEANRTLKNKIVENPHGILMITPESLEAMFINKPYDVKRLFSNLKYIVIDEIHSFIGSDRGTQLKSIIARLRLKNHHRFCIVGLSATIGSYDEAKCFTGEAERTKILLDKTHKDSEVSFAYFEGENEQELPLSLLKNIYNETINNRVLIFPNTRGRVEEVAVKLRKLSSRLRGHGNYFAHHSSIDKDRREQIESFAKESNGVPFCITCTSTLELGIDIGGIDEVIQIDSTFSVSSLIQRAGRSGREDGKCSKLHLVATRKWSLIQAMACWLLYKKGFIEPPEICEKPYDILVHQSLSIIKSSGGIDIDLLVNNIHENAAFVQVDVQEVLEILHYLISTNIVERLRNELIIGVDGEPIVNSRDFYSVFKTVNNFEVIHKGARIGELPLSPQLTIESNVLLSARIWKIVDIDNKARKIFVVPALDGKKPVFFGEGGDVNNKITEEMFTIIFSNANYEFLDTACSDVLKMVRSDFHCFADALNFMERPVILKEDKCYFYPFIGSRVIRTLELLFKHAEIAGSFNAIHNYFELDVNFSAFMNTWNNLTQSLINVDVIIEQLIIENPNIIRFSKWGFLLPLKYQILLMKDKYFDIPGCLEFVRKVKIITAQKIG